MKKDELQKYIDAATTEREKGRLRVALQHAAEEYSQLEKDDVKLELELRKLKDGLGKYDLDSPANRVYRIRKGFILKCSRCVSRNCFFF